MIGDTLLFQINKTFHASAIQAPLPRQLREEFAKHDFRNEDNIGCRS
jgi:hypothetical protein